MVVETEGATSILALLLLRAEAQHVTHVALRSVNRLADRNGRTIMNNGPTQRQSTFTAEQSVNVSVGFGHTVVVLCTPTWPPSTTT